MTTIESSHSGEEAPVGSTAAPAHREFANTSQLQNLLRLLTRRVKWIIGSILICVLLAILVTWITKPAYQSTATIELNKETGTSMELGLGDELSQQLTSGADSLQTDLQTETSILQGDSLALAVIQRLNLASQPPFAAKNMNGPEHGLPLEDAPLTRTRLLDIFKRRLKVKPVRGTRLIQATYESNDPKQAAQIANALIDSYKSQYLQSHYDATSEASDWLTKQLSTLKSNVEESEKRLTDFEKANGILALQTGYGANAKGGGGQEEVHSVVIEKLDALNTELTAAEANTIEKEAIYRLAKTENPDLILGLGNNSLAEQGNSIVFTQGGGLSNLQLYEQQQTQLKLNLADAATTYGANNRHLKEIQTQVQALDGPIREEMQKIIKRAETDLQLAHQAEDGIRRQFDQQQLQASKLDEKMVEFTVLSDEALSRKRLYEDLYTKLQEADVSAGIKATNITIVDPARTQSVPVRPKGVTNLALGVLFGIFVGFASAYIVDNFDRTLRGPLEVEEITGIPVIGVIPSFGETSRSYGYGLRREKAKVTNNEARTPGDSVWMLTHPESAAAEAFRALRTSIMLSRAGKGPKLILITSSIPAEGKTTVTTNLAVAFAQHDKKVIIVEADMRRPGMKHAFDVVSKVGLSNVLTGSCTMDQALLRGVGVSTLDVLPAGPHPPMPSEILGSTAFDSLLEQLRSTYDIVLIDSPPALLVTDAVSMSAKSDATVWVAQAGVVTRPQLARASSTIERNRMPVIGFVVNQMTRLVAGYGYGYGYGYEYDSYHSYYGEEKPHDT